MSALRCVWIVRGLRDLGLTEAEIQQLARTCDNNPRLVGPPLAALLHRSRTRIDARIVELEQQRRRIDTFGDRYREALAGHHNSCTPDPWRPNPGEVTAPLDSPTAGIPDAGDQDNHLSEGDPGMTADRFAATIADTLFGPDQHTGRSLMRTTMRLLAHGTPVTVAELAAAAGVDAADLRNAPAGNDIEYDDQGRIVGWGLTLNPAPHTYIVDGHHLYTWCAADTLLFPAILGRSARVESRCPTTDTVIRLTIDPHTGVTALSPDTAVISIPGAQEMDITRVRATTCNPGRFFATAEAAQDWLAQHPDGTVQPVADAYPRLRRISDQLLRGS